MSEAMPQFNVIRPQTLDQAIAALQSQPNARLCAGGTDLIVNMRRGLVDAQTLVDLTGVAGLNDIQPDRDGLRIGAGVTLRALAQHPGIAKACGAVSQAANGVAAPAHREAATVGGNLCVDTRCLYYNQSHWWRKSNGFCLKYRGDTCHVAPKGNRCRAAYSGDLAPALMVHGASIDLAGPDGTRRIALADLYHEDGANYLTIQPGEILTGVVIPAGNAASSYDKIKVRGAFDFALAGIAVACKSAPDGARQFSVAITGTNSMPVNVDIPQPLGKDDDIDSYFAALGKLVQKTVSPQRTSTVAPHYRRLSAAALTIRLARGLL